MAAEIIDRALMQDQILSTPQSALERFFHSLGLMTGDNAPWYRMAFSFGILSVGMFALRPGFAFKKNGEARPFRFFAPDDPESTLVPWWLIPLGGAIFSGLFV